MLSNLNSLTPKVLGAFRQIPKHGLSNPSFNQRLVMQVAARQPYKAQQASATSHIERKPFISQAAIVKGVKPLSTNIQPGIQQRIQQLFDNQVSVTPSVNPSSNPTTPFVRVKTASSAPKPAQLKPTVTQATAKPKRLSNDTFRLQRFIDAQNRGYRHGTPHHQALEEMRRGRKQSHWSWYELPIVNGFGQSRMSHYFALNSLEEVHSYYANEILKPRLLEIFSCINSHQNTPIQVIMGSRCHHRRKKSSKHQSKMTCR
ncbi:DUF1810 family protein [Endozoicomonas atrinae]|uniref:DUF1810 family protein n=1 Tax=Endozoicomonas atrinae TaxID=1333660 RepID=UPI0009F3272C|nr:DUF1810 family protein [Endozoicomonas atrinae]